MLTTAKICAILLAGGLVGATVQKHSSPKREVGRPAQVKGKPGVSLSGASGARAGHPRQPPASPPRILDCPTPAPSLGPGEWAPPPSPALPPVAGEAPRLPLPPFGQPGGGGGTAASPPSFPPAVPEPGTWAMMLAGFGLVGLSLRSRREPHDNA
jgi:hypothetical protein